MWIPQQIMYIITMVTEVHHPLPTASNMTIDHPQNGKSQFRAFSVEVPQFTMLFLWRTSTEVGFVHICYHWWENWRWWNTSYFKRRPCQRTKIRIPAATASAHDTTFNANSCVVMCYPDQCFSGKSSHRLCCDCKSSAVLLITKSKRSLC